MTLVKCIAEFQNDEKEGFAGFARILPLARKPEEPSRACSKKCLSRFAAELRGQSFIYLRDFGLLRNRSPNFALIIENVVSTCSVDGSALRILRA